jgi:hypothetical protein
LPELLSVDSTAASKFIFFLRAVDATAASLTNGEMHEVGATMSAMAG